MAGQEGFEPPTLGFGVRCSTNSSYWPARLVHVIRRTAPTRPRAISLFGFAMGRMLATEPAILAELKFVRCRSFVFGRRIISSLAFLASEGHDDSHCIISLIAYATISLTTPAPTVRPPSRIAKRNSFSIAIGVINSASIATLSPGITISTPSGNVKTPVTSVVRK